MADPLYGKKEDGRGKHMIVPITDFRKQAFLKWLCTPIKEREPRTMELLAEQLQTTRRTLTTWKTDDKEFIEAWEKMYLRTIGNPERKQSIMDTLYKTATDGDDPKHVAAAKQYFEIEGSIKPSRVEVSMSKPATELTDEQLDEILAVKAQSEKLHREAS